MIVALRIDDRLVHGQVALAWCKALGSQGILVANDQVCNNELQKMALKMATPVNVKLLVQPVAQAIGVLKNPKARSMHIMVLVTNVRDALEICRQLPEIKEVNLAGTGRLEGGEEGKIVLVKSSVFLKPEELGSLKELVSSGVRVYNQQLPTHEKTDVAKLLERIDH